MVQNKVTQENRNIEKQNMLTNVGNLKNFLYFVRDQESFSDCDGRSQ